MRVARGRAIVGLGARLGQGHRIMIPEVVEKLLKQLQQQTELSSIHKYHPQDVDYITWSWVCVKLFKLLSKYPSGVTPAIVLSELYQELQNGGGRLLSTAIKSRKRVTVSSLLELKTVAYESVLEVRAQSPYEIPGTTTRIVHLAECEDDTRYIEMYLHKKFYDMPRILTAHSLRMTCCRLVPETATRAQGGKRPSLRLLPTEVVVIVLDPAEEHQYQNSFLPLEHLQRGSITQPDYIQNIFSKVVDIGSEEVVHTPDGTAFNRLIVQLLGHTGSGQTTPLILWDLYVGFARLFDKGDILYLEQPYAKPTSDGHLCLEHGPATVMYVVPFEPPQEIVPSQHPNQRTPIRVKKTDDGKLDFASYPERLMITDVVPNMIGGVLFAQCMQVCVKESVVKDDGNVVEKYRLLIADQTGSVLISILDPGFRTFERVHRNQWLLFCGVCSHTDDNGDIALICHLGEGGMLYNASSLSGVLASPTLCSHVLLTETGDRSPGDFTTVARITGWFYTSDDNQPVNPVHCTCRNTVKQIPTGGTFMCELCSASSLVEVKEISKSLELRDEHKYWKWEFSLGAKLQDTGGTIKARLTPSAAEDVLQRTSLEFSALSSSEQLELLHGLDDQLLTLCVSKIDDVSDIQFQINMASKKSATHI